MRNWFSDPVLNKAGWLKMEATEWNGDLLLKSLAVADWCGIFNRLAGALDNFHCGGVFIFSTAHPKWTYSFVMQLGLYGCAPSLQNKYLSNTLAFGLFSILCVQIVKMSQLHRLIAVPLVQQPHFLSLNKLHLFQRNLVLGEVLYQCISVFWWF